MTHLMARIGRFGTVGAACTALQALVMVVLLRHAVEPTLAFAVGFAASAQANYLLSRSFTWADRHASTSDQTSTQWAAYNVTALLGLAGSSFVFHASRQSFDIRLATILGVATSSVITFTIADRLLFRRSLEYVSTARPVDQTAMITATPEQKLILVVVGCLLLVALAGEVAGQRWPMLALVAVVTVVYVIDLGFCAYLVAGSMLRRQRPGMAAPADPEQWPTYTVLCPLYREGAVLEQFMSAMDNLDYPADSLQVLLLLEQDDIETIDFVHGLHLPPSFEIVVVPAGQPQTKPRACNYGLRHARGEYVVIFDAEDVPEPQQLKKAARTFQYLPYRIACLQAPLNFYNPRQNILTRLFAAEYSLWFDLLLVGLQRLKGPIPLGGTSNHFRSDVLRGLGGWDIYNVTEDADLGVRLYKRGFRTEMLDSVTYEEANSHLVNWIRQRSRWIKGYLQTLLVHSRGGWDLRRTRDVHFLTFLLIVGGKAIANYVNPVMWAMTIAYFVLRPRFGPAIEALYPRPVAYAAVASLLLGNLLFTYMFVLGSARRGNYDLIKYGLLAPLYWLLMSVAAWKAMWQLIHAPHYWEKTDHGLHLEPNVQTATLYSPEGVLL